MENLRTATREELTEIIRTLVGQVDALQAGVRELEEEVYTATDLFGHEIR